jgi:hypothetical protein
MDESKSNADDGKSKMRLEKPLHYVVMLFEKLVMTVFTILMYIFRFKISLGSFDTVCSYEVSENIITS